MSTIISNTLASDSSLPVSHNGTLEPEYIFDRLRPLIKAPASLILFGSVLRPDDFREDSDIDVGIVFPDSVPDEDCRMVSEMFNLLNMKISGHVVQFTSFKILDNQYLCLGH